MCRPVQIRKTLNLLDHKDISRMRSRLCGNVHCRLSGVRSLPSAAAAPHVNVVEASTEFSEGWLNRPERLCA